MLKYVKSYCFCFIAKLTRKVAHVCALLRRNILGYSIRETKLNLDKLIFPTLKAAEDTEVALKDISTRILGSTVEKVGRHGKYFWIRLQKPKLDPTVMLMHFGMTGMVKLRNVDSHMIFMENGGDKKVLKGKQTSVGLDKGVEEQVKIEILEGTPDSDLEGKSCLEAEWPPRFTKFELVFDKDNESGTEKHVLDFAFTDPRRLGRVRFLTGPQYATDEQLLLEEPLNALGPDYSKSPEFKEVAEFVTGDPDPDHHGRPRPTLEEFSKLVLSRKKPIKALLLDQDQFAGIGNWVSDEILYHAQIYPGEVISNKISDASSEVLKRLYNAIIYIMEESVRVEGDVHQFPDNWLMLYRWGKGRKQPKAKTKQGYTVDHETIGGRTSCFVPELQKPLKKVKVKEDSEGEEKPKRSKKQKTK